MIEQVDGLDRRAFLQGVALLGLGAAVASPLAGCSSSSAGPAASKPLTIGLNVQWLSVDTKSAQFDGQLTLLRAVREGITGLDGNLMVVPLLAESITSSNDTEFKVVLRSGLTYSDGTAVTSSDVKVAMESFANAPKWGFKNQFPEIPEVQVVDERNLVLVTKQPIPNLPRLMSNITVIPAKVNGARDVDSAPATGPYMLHSFDKGKQTVELVPNPKYRGKTAGPARVVGKYFADESARLAALKTGEIQYVDALLPASAQSLQSTSGITVLRKPGTRLSHLAYNFRNPTTPLLKDAAVREALSYAIDGDSLIDKLLLKSVSPLEGVVPSTLDGAAKVGQFTYDPDRAKSMLHAAGADDLRLTIIWENGEFFSIAEVMEAIVDMFSKVGVKATLKEFAQGSNIGDWRLGNGGKFDILGNGLGNQTGAALDTLLIFAGTAAKEKDRLTYQGYVFPDVTDAIVKASSEIDATKRSDLLRTAQQLLWNTRPALWGFTQNNAVAFRNSVKGVELAPNDRLDLTKVRVT